jgi:hypothetical protein
MCLAASGCGGGSGITAKVRPVRTPTRAQCLGIAQKYAAGSETRAENLCKEANERSNWFHAEIAYRGGKASWITCAVEGFDTQGRRLWHNPWGLPLDPRSSFPGVSAAYVEPGTSLTVTWFLLGHQAGPVARYQPTCKTVPYPPV